MITLLVPDEGALVKVTVMVVESTVYVLPMA